MAETKRTGVSHLSKFYGRKPGQTLSEFAAETRQLSDEDFTQLRDGIQDGTHDYTATPDQIKAARARTDIRAELI